MAGAIQESMTHMRILWLSHFVPYPPKGGVLQRGYHLLKETARYHEVHLLAFNQRELMRPFFSSVDAGIDAARSHLGQFCDSITIVPLPGDDGFASKHRLALASLLKATPYTMNWLLSEDYAAQLKTLLQQHDFDFVHFDTISLAPYRRYCGTLPCSLDHHNIESHMLLRRASKQRNPVKKAYFWLEGKWLERAERQYCPEFDFNFTCSDIDTARLQNLSPQCRAFTIPNGVDTAYFSPRADATKGDRLLFIGSLNWYPNVEAVEFIANGIWPAIKKRYPDIAIDIVGANPPKSIERLAKTDPSFRVHGFVDDILPFFASAKCYVCPIKDGGGTKLKILDALAMGMAIVADEVACEGIEVEDRQSVVFARSVDEYVTAIGEVLENDALRLTLEQGANSLARERYSVAAIGKRLADLFTEYGHPQHPPAAAAAHAAGASRALRTG